MSWGRIFRGAMSPTYRECVQAILFARERERSITKIAERVGRRPFKKEAQFQGNAHADKKPYPDSPTSYAAFRS